MKPIYLLSLFLIMSCQNEVKKNDIDTVIKKYDKTNFSFFKNTFVGIRERNSNEIIYIVDKAEGSLPVYFVKYSIRKKSIIEINKRALEEKNIRNYFTDKEIHNLIENFQKFDLSLLQVDKDGNIFMNPFEINEHAVLLRLANSSDKKEVQKGYVYEHYKGNWYIRK